MKGFLYLFLFVLISLTSCDTGNSSGNVSYTPASTNTVPRFEVHSQGKFKAGYANSEREILLIKDTKTGIQYLGITDVSLIKIKHEEYEEATEELLDIATQTAGE